eukprot:scaffold73822_cov48-Phaeocystis_antarctica.AAC.1
MASRCSPPSTRPRTPCTTRRAGEGARCGGPAHGGQCDGAHPARLPGAAAKGQGVVHLPGRGRRRGLPEPTEDVARPTFPGAQ